MCPGSEPPFPPALPPPAAFDVFEFFDSGISSSFFWTLAEVLSSGKRRPELLVHQHDPFLATGPRFPPF